MKTIIITSYKGGVGKTLISFNFAGYLHNKGHRVLVIDLDGQMNMTRNMLPPGKKSSLEHSYSTADIYSKNVKDESLHPMNLIYKNPFEHFEGFDMIPSKTDLKEYEDLYAVKNQATMNLSLFKWIKTYRGILDSLYDFIIVDSSPNLSVGTLTALTAADEIFLITDVSGNSLTGAVDLCSKWDSICEDLKMDNNISLTFANNVDTRTGMGMDFIGNVSKRRELEPDKYCEHFIKNSSKIKESELVGPVSFFSNADFTSNPGVISMINTFNEIYERRDLGGSKK